MDKTTPSSTTASQSAEALRIVASAAFAIFKGGVWIVFITAFVFLAIQICRSFGDYLLALDKIPAIAIILGSCFFSWTMALSCVKMPPENKLLFFLKYFSVASALFMFCAGLFIHPIPSGKGYMVILTLISFVNLVLQVMSSVFTNSFRN